MPLNDFFDYTVLNKHADFLRVLININPKHEIFKGHFPGNPVTPGVTQIEMIRRVLSECLKKELMLTRARDIKYLTPIIPQQTHHIEINIDYTEENGSFETRCILSHGDKVFTKFRGTFSEQ